MSAVGIWDFYTAHGLKSDDPRTPSYMIMLFLAVSCLITMHVQVKPGVPQIF